jgi:hypothetical protein
MNERINKIGVESGMLNYVDNETPRHYFLSGHADEQDLERFAKMIVIKCAEVADTAEPFLSSDLIKQHFGVEE